MKISYDESNNTYFQNKNRYLDQPSLLNGNRRHSAVLLLRSVTQFILDRSMHMRIAGRLDSLAL